MGILNSKFPNSKFKNRFQNSNDFFFWIPISLTKVFGMYWGFRIPNSQSQNSKTDFKSWTIFYFFLDSKFLLPRYLGCVGDSEFQIPKRKIFKSITKFEAKYSVLLQIPDSKIQIRIGNERNSGTWPIQKNQISNAALVKGTGVRVFWVSFGVLERVY